VIPQKMDATAATLKPRHRSANSTIAAKAEARALFGLVERGSSTVEAEWELIEVLAADEQRLRAFAEAEPTVAGAVPVLRFRRRVLREFNRLVEESTGVRSASVYVDVPVAMAGTEWNSGTDIGAFAEHQPRGEDKGKTPRGFLTGHLALLQYGGPGVIVAQKLAGIAEVLENEGSP